MDVDGPGPCRIAFTDFGICQHGAVKHDLWLTFLKRACNGALIRDSKRCSDRVENIPLPKFYRKRSAERGVAARDENAHVLFLCAESGKPYAGARNSR